MRQRRGRRVGIEVLTFELPPGYGSDHVAFMSAGVEAVFLFADDVTYINSPRDTVEHLEYEPIAQASGTYDGNDTGAGRKVAGRGAGWDKIIETAPFLAGRGQ